MKLHEIQQKLKAPKSQYNSFGKYHYRNCEDILEALKPLLEDSLLTLSDEVVQVGNRNYVKATATFLEHFEVLANGDDRFKAHTVTAYACEAAERKGMDASQITGATSSYARKYALNGLFLIDDTKDADSAEEAHQTAKTAPRATPAAPTKQETMRELDIQKERISFLLKSLGFKGKTKNEYTAAVYDMTKLHLTAENYEKIAEALSAKLEAKEQVANQ